MTVFSESQEAIDKNFYFEPQAEIAVFVERLFEHSSLKSYKRRAFLANPEWLTKRDLQLAENVISEFWHKTRFGMKLLTTKLPKKEHHYIGFTSLPKPGLVDTYLDFAHFVHFANFAFAWALVAVDFVDYNNNNRFRLIRCDLQFHF